MASTQAQDMVRKIEADLKSNGAGVKQVSSDGQTVIWDRNQALSELDYWRRQATIQSGSRKLFRSVNIRSAWTGQPYSNGVGEIDGLA